MEEGDNTKFIPSFNSTIVRLRPVIGLQSALLALFQFYNSSIKTEITERLDKPLTGVSILQ